MSEDFGIKLTDLVDVSVLQKIQDAFSNATGLAALTTEADGTPVTKGSNFTKYCMEYTRKSELGCHLCEECDRFGAEETLRTGRTTTYECHSGLIDFSAPILADGHIVGCFIGGQALFEAPNEERVREIARTLDLDEDEYWNAIQEIPVRSSESVDKAAEFLSTVASVLSDLAYSRYLSIRANEDLARAAKMQGDFLANMSHEIRTPMNAIIGFAEMALREDLPEVAKGYIKQIKSSGNALLTIINDILDYSKIESGKMEIIPVDYEPLSMIDDIATIIMTRLVDKEVELLLDVNPHIPAVLNGDNIRLRQILINLCNNATKFTNIGHVKVSVDYEWLDYSNINIKFAISDTGIGIKKDDIDKIFNSFQQVDSKRNRNIEGSGLGLAICRNLLELMGGKLEVESEYGVGSTFSFAVRQKVVNSTPSIIIDDPDMVCLGGAFYNEDVEEYFVKDAKDLGLIPNIMHYDTKEERIKAVEEWADSARPGQDIFFFVEQRYFDPNILNSIHSKNIINTVVIADTFSDLRNWDSYPNLMILRKPVSALNLGSLLNYKSVSYLNSDAQDDSLLYTAEGAKVLVVDDNVVNLSVASGLLQPLKMKIEEASSGKEAIRKCQITKYDIILMDHMMPGMDGIETTHFIRENVPLNKETPIIALTANAISGMKEMFISEGMNDFIAKPIEVRILLEVIKRYLPRYLVKKADSKNEFEVPITESTEELEELVIADLDTEYALKMLGSKDLFMNILKIYYENIDIKAESIRRLFESEDWEHYAIEVHALKSSSRQIGALELGDLAYELEMAGKNQDVYIIKRDTDRLLKEYLDYKPKLKPYFEDKSKISDAGKPVANAENLKKIFGRLRVAISELDMDAMEEAVAKMEDYTYPEHMQLQFDNLKTAVASMDVEECIVLLDNWH